MSFGITLNRFSVNLKFKNTEHVGLGMVIAGLFILTWSHRRFKTVREAIDKGELVSTHKSISKLTVAALVLGGLMTIWMFFSHS